MSRPFPRLSLALLCLASLARIARADVVPGDVITAANVDKAKDLISPGLEWCVRFGMPLRIMATRPATWPKAYKEATGKYSAQVKLAADGLTMSGYVAGQPCPNTEPMDPQVANKIMGNYDYNYFITDDVDLRNFDSDTGAIAKNGPMTIERHFALDHFLRLFWTGGPYLE